jgi:hypothetical protein
LAATLQESAGASLRAGGSPNVLNKIDQVAAIIAKAEAANSTKTASPAKPAEGSSAQPVQHKKLDVGFSAFEENLTTQVSTKLLRAATGTAWNDDLRGKFTKNVTDSVKESFKVLMKPLKQSIGKTWMALPQDEQKDQYVDALKKSFENVFENSMKTVESHLDLSLKRVTGYSSDKTDAMSPSELLEKSELSVADSLITDHCYESTLHSSAKSNTSNATAEKKKFCINSVLGALAHRLNDTQGLISMSMRFDAGAMSALQKGHKAPKASKAPVKWGFVQVSL